MSYQHQTPDQDAIARNLVYLDFGHIEITEAIPHEHTLSAIAALNEALDATRAALRTSDPPEFWHQLFPTLSDASALLHSEIAPLIDLNAEREAEEQSPTPVPLALAIPKS